MLLTKFENVLLGLILLLAIGLRFFNLASNPPGLYWDEAVIGYDAYSVLKTGADHHGHFMPLFFESFGDWKLPVYEYTLVPAIYIFGLDEFSIRLPSALLGSLSVLLLYLIVKSQTKNIKLALLSSLLLAISPWHIQFSRAGFESTVALFIFLLGFYFLIKSDFKKLSQMVLGIMLIAISQYAYHSYRIFAPLFIIGLIIVYKNFFLKFKKRLAIAVVTFTVISLPILIFSFSPNGISRAASESAFNNLNIEKERVYFDQRSKPPFRFLSKYLFQKPLYLSQIVLKNYLDHFSPTFLFFRGDQVGRHSLGDIGQINIFELPLLILGLYALKDIKNRKFVNLCLLWLILAPIPAAFVNPTPHANRSLAMVIPLTIISAVGLYYLFTKTSKIIVTVFCIWMLLVVLIFMHQLFGHYPKKNAPDWQDGYKSMYLLLSGIDSKYNKVYITKANGVPYIYFLLFNKYDPRTYQKSGSPDSIGKYIFTQNYPEVHIGTKALYAAPPWQNVEGSAIGQISDNFNRVVFKIWELKGHD